MMVYLKDRIVIAGNKKVQKLQSSMNLCSFICIEAKASSESWYYGYYCHPYIRYYGYRVYYGCYYGSILILMEQKCQSR